MIIVEIIVSVIWMIVTVYFLKDCLTNKYLTRADRVIYLLTILILPVVGICVYQIHEKSREQTMQHLRKSLRRKKY